MGTEVGLGGFPEFVFEEFHEDHGVALGKVPSMSELMHMSRDALRNWLLRFHLYSHIVFRLSGENPSIFIHVLKSHGLLEEFTARAYSASFWTMDSHHLGRQEKEASKYFDHVFVAHKNYLDMFPVSTYLPCSYSLTSKKVADELLRVKAKSLITEDTGVCAIFAAYSWQSRNKHYLEWRLAAEDLAVRSFFGTVRGGSFPNQFLIEKTLSFSTTLNFSLSNDLNMRNFEALALNRVLITNHLPDHEILSEFNENIFFMSHGSPDVWEQLTSALKIQPASISRRFLELHGIGNRLALIVRTLDPAIFTRGTEVETSKTSEKSTVNSRMSEVRESVHTAEVLAGRSGRPSLSLAKEVLSRSSNPVVSGSQILLNWLASALHKTLSVCLGQRSAFRARVILLQGWIRGLGS